MMMKNGVCSVACRHPVKLMEGRSRIAVLCNLKSKRRADIDIVRG